MTALQSRVGAFCSMRGFRPLSNDEPVGSILRRMKQEDPESYQVWWEEHPNETWERIDADSEERDAAWLKELDNGIKRIAREKRIARKKEIAA